MLVERTLAALAGSPDGLPAEATDVLLLALAASKSDSARWRIVYALGRAAQAERHDVVDVLLARYREWQDNPFLAPEVLDALATLAQRSPLALAEMRSLLLRLGFSDSRYVLVRASKVIARLECLGFRSDARALLDQLADHDDDAISAEALQQLAVLTLYDTLQRSDISGIRAGLQNARNGFTRAALAEENRFDARLGFSLSELLLTFLDHQASGAPGSNELLVRAQSVVDLVVDPAVHPWFGYASGGEALLEHRVFRIADGFTRIAKAAQGVDEWTNFDEALLELAAVFRLMWQTGRDSAREGMVGALGALEATVVVPQFGPFLVRAVGRARLRRVITNHEARFGVDERAVVLRRLYEAGIEEYTTAQPADAEVLQKVNDAYGADMRHIVSIPLDHPACYGNDPSVDRAVRPILDQAWARLGPHFPRSQWIRLVDVTVSIVQFARDIRDTLPSFALCSEDGGMGQTAGEHDLQEYVFRRLGEKHGRDTLWEPSRTGGGRVDSGIRFEGFEVPIEVKAEYHDISREHVQAHYVGQADDYATARDGVAILLILDLRAENSSRHMTRRRAARKADNPDGPGVKLYPLSEAFWVTGLPPDPQITAGRENVVMVGLVQGNRAKPSSGTTYSSRPRRGSQS